MSDRFFVAPPIEGQRVLLGGSEAHHLIHVMRLQPGDTVILFDGSGAEFRGQIANLRRSEVEIDVLARAVVDRELPLSLTLGVALPKGDRQKWLVEKMVELGVTSLVPLRTVRSVAQPGNQALDRLQRTVIEACKQCGRNRLMELAEPRDWSDYVGDAPAAAWRLIAHPATSDPPGIAAGVSHPMRNDVQRRPIFLAVGPEGGFSEEEVTLATATGWQVRDLGPRLLRVETAALFLVASAIVQSQAWE